MPTVPNIAGQPSKAVRVITQPPPSDVTDEPIPEKALTAADIIPPTQAELAELSIQTQNVAKRNTMTPNSEPPKPIYAFTDADRQKAEAARKAAQYPWETAPLDGALAHLAEIRAETEKGGLVLQRRVSEQKIEKVKCFGCDNIINLSEGRWATMRTRNNFETGLPESAYACSAACGLKLNREFSHPVRIPAPREG